MKLLRYPTILVGTDLSSISRQAAHAAGDLAVICGSERVHLVHVLTMSEIFGTPIRPPTVLEEIEEIRREAIARRSAALEDVVLKAGRAIVTREVRVGSPAEELVRAADVVRADMIVAASHGRSLLGRTILGSVTSNLIRIAHCPVMITGERRETINGARRVLAAIDLSSVSTSVLAHAFALASNMHAMVHVLSVYEPPLMAGLEIGRNPHEHRMAVEALVEDAERANGPAAEIDLRVGNASKLIFQAAEETRADLIVVGTSGHNAFQRVILGSTATHVLSKADRPVLVVPIAKEAREVEATREPESP
jgi:nucleotide-binding universal stress UspA family protein